MTNRTRGFFVGFGLAAASTFLALLLAESVLRLYPSVLPPGVQVRLHWQVLRGQDTTASVADPFLGALPAPHQHTELRHADFSFTYETDRFGFRNAEPWPDTAEVVAVGDSWVFGYGADLPDSWFELMLKQVPDIRAVNLGIVGAAPQQYVRAYQRYGIPLHPRVLILGLFPGNDLDDARTFDEWVRAASPGNYDEWKYVRRGAFRTWLLGHSYLAMTIRDVLKNRHSPFDATTITAGDGGRLRLAPGFFKGLPERARPGQPDFQLVLSSLTQADSIARQNGTKLLVLLFPTKEAVYLPIIGKPAPVGTEAFRAELEARDIECIDFLPIFRAQGRAGATLYFTIDGHANAAGNRLIATTLVDHLSRHKKAYGLDRRTPPSSSGSQ